MEESERKEQKEQSAAARIGMDYAVKLSYTAVDKSDLVNKRDVLYSLLCFGCMFDDSFATDPDPILRKYDCLRLPEPKKLDLYELAYLLVTLPAPAERQKELRMAWYMAFAYVLISEAPHNEIAYEKLREILHTQEVFASVLQSRYSVYIPATRNETEAQGVPGILAEWYAPYQSYCAERDENGVTRETSECRRLLALGRFSDVCLRAERLLASFPDDCQIALTDIAARVSLSGATDEKSRVALLKDTLSLIDDYLPVAEGQYFRYYRGLTLLGLMDTVGARAEFDACLQADPKFEPAMLMIKGMDKYRA